MLRLTEIREAKGMSKYKLAKISGVSRPYIIQLEKGEHLPRIDIVCMLCKALGVELNELVIFE